MYLPLPDLESVRCFVEVAQALSFRAAATRVFLSPAAVTDRIQRLEEFWQVALFARSTRAVRLTADGERLLPRAKQLLATAWAVATPADGRAVPFELTLGTRYELGLSWLVPALEPLERARPERTLHLAFGEHDDLLNQTLRGLVDATVSSGPVRSPQLEFAALHDEAYTLVAAPAALRRTPWKRLTSAALGGHRLLDLRPDLPLTRYLLDGTGVTLGGAQRLAFLGTLAAVRARLLAGAGLAVLPRYFVRGDLQRGRLKDLLPGQRLPSDVFRLVWRVGHPHTHELRALAEALRERPLR